MMDKTLCGESILGSCGGDLFSFWSLVSMIDDSLGEMHIVRTNKNLLNAWLSLVDVTNQAISDSMVDEGDINGIVTFFLSR